MLRGNIAHQHLKHLVDALEKQKNVSPKKFPPGLPVGDSKKKETCKPFAGGLTRAQWDGSLAALVKSRHLFYK